MRTEPRRSGLYSLLALGIFLPFYLNDIVYLADPAWPLWLLTDYGSRAIALACLALICWPPMPAGSPWPRSLVIAVALAALGFAAINEFWLYPWMKAALPFGAAVAFPEIPLAWLRWADMLLGLALVAISEELVFRGFLLRALIGRGLPVAAAVLTAALLFGLIHWTLGLPGVIQASLYGVILGALYLGSRSLRLPILIHYAADLLAFA